MLRDRRSHQRLVGGDHERHLWDGEEQLDRLERHHDGLRKTAVKVIDQNDDAADVLEILHELCELRAKPWSVGSATSGLSPNISTRLSTLGNVNVTADLLASVIALGHLMRLARPVNFSLVVSHSVSSLLARVRRASRTSVIRVARASSVGRTPTGACGRRSCARPGEAPRQASREPSCPTRVEEANYLVIPQHIEDTCRMGQ